MGDRWAPPGDIGGSRGCMTPDGLEPMPVQPRGSNPDKAVLAQSLAEKTRLARALQQHFALVWRSVRRFGVPESAADDAAQQVFLIFSERLADVESGRERSFLLAVSVRVAANVRRLFARSREVPLDGLEEALAAETTPEQLLEAKEERDVLDQALATLPLPQRAIFVLFELEGFSLPEIAESLGIPLGTATSRLRRARVRFEAWVTEHQASRGQP
jgi:RNA polymerase sigma-70 factor, ECF subfamily